MPHSGRPNSIQNCQSGFGRAKRLRFVKASIGVLRNLLARFKVPVVGVIVFVLTVFGCIVTTDFRSRFIDATPIVVLQVFTFGVNKNEPVVIFGENTGEIMQQVPAQIIKIGSGLGSINRQRKISATFACAILTEDFVRF